jgi:hypothetical protein
MTPRIGIAGFLHESNTFLGVPTEYENFTAASLTRGPELLQRWTGAHHELGGFLAGLEGAAVEIVPLLATFAVPSGTISAVAFERIAGELLGMLREAGRLDGLLLALHGATVSADFPDADGEILCRIREVAGPDLPIVTTFDLHANVSRRMIALSSASIAYRTNPHLDQYERGREAARLLLRILRGEVRPVQALETPPLIIQISKQYTAQMPAKRLYDELEKVLSWPGILTAGIAMGFYYADVPEMGASFFATADNDPALARRAARHLAEFAWLRRAELTGSLPSPAEAVAVAIAAPQGPVVLMEVGDNVGAGGPANSTVLFAEILRQRGTNALVILCDPASVEVCLAHRPGDTVQFRAGDPAIEIQGRLRTLSDGRFVETEIRHGGWGACDQGLTAVVETDDGHTIVLTSRRMAPMSLQQILSLGIRPERKKILIAKGVVAPRAAYAPVASEIILVDTPGVTSDNPRHFEYRNRRAMYPLEPEVTF